jgi:protein-tyrosine phosphatase
MLKRLYLRDVGGEMTNDGRRVRTGRLYRSSAIHKLRRDERRQLDALGLRHIIDLREPKVAARWPDTIRAEVMSHLPVGMGILEMVKPREVLSRQVDWWQLAHPDLYADVLESNAGQVRRFFDSLIDQPAPALVHCTAGKDRTGILVSMLYLALGVPRERVVQAYLAIRPHLEQHFPATLQWLVRAFGGPPLAYSVVGEYMERMLDRVDQKFNGVAGFIDSIQFARLESLHDRFLE